MYNFLRVTKLLQSPFSVFIIFAFADKHALNVTAAKYAAFQVITTYNRAAVTKDPCLRFIRKPKEKFLKNQHIIPVLVPTNLTKQLILFQSSCFRKLPRVIVSFTHKNRINSLLKVICPCFQQNNIIADASITSASVPRRCPSPPLYLIPALGRTKWWTTKDLQSTTCHPGCLCPIHQDGPWTIYLPGTFPGPQRTDPKRRGAKVSCTTPKIDGFLADSLLCASTFYFNCLISSAFVTFSILLFFLLV